MATPFDGTADQDAAAAIAARDDAHLARLLTLRIEPDAAGAEGITLLHWAVLNGADSACGALLDAGADPLRPDDDGDTPLHCAAMADDPACLTILLGRQVDPDAINPHTGRTPLLEAVLHQRHSNARALLAAAANPNIADRCGETPLHVAAELDEHTTVLDLLQAGADPVAENAQGVTFQRYLFMTPSMLRPAPARAVIEQIAAWLRDNGIPLENG
ncbi:ankyrin repeat domain-containing protein [Nocardia jinanensis]|uniref:Phospholipase A n=1 Tax=Nocardia jinanensis TaxID=382504 RepID=A0A917RWB4_9NOCA|nr:ankyrin repeat domain-containing protein [Nocardia jinanensis]GGL40724.1 phospholipase A [Nocardia jinanensis]